MPTITVQYPREKLIYPPRARTELRNAIESCNGCLQCARACPVEIIHIETAKAQDEDNAGNMPDGKPRKLLVLTFDVEMSKCVHCGLCVEVCPTESMHWNNEHEHVTFTREELMRHWATYPPEEVRRLQERDEILKAEKAKQAAEAAAKKAAAGDQPAPKPVSKPAADGAEKPAQPSAAAATPAIEKPAKPESGDGTDSPQKENGKEKA